jgi:hypothetical protein
VHQFHPERVNQLLPLLLHNKRSKKNIFYFSFHFDLFHHFIGLF